MDPHDVLGLEPGASLEEIHRAYRALAKRFHPDHADVGDGELMISINAAYDLLRDTLVEGRAERAPATTAAGDPAPAPVRRPYGDWLDPAVRAVLAAELRGALEPGEPVHEVLLTGTGDSHDVQLAITDRRLLWLRDDAILGRVRYVRYRELRAVGRRGPGRLRRSAELRADAVDGRRLRFFGLAPEALDRVVALIRPHIARPLG